MSVAFRCLARIVLCLAFIKSHSATFTYSEEYLTTLATIKSVFLVEEGIDLTHNSLSEINADETVCAESPLAFLDLSYNKINYIEVGSFKGCLSLSVLYLNSNELTAFPDLRNLAGVLETLSVAANEIQTVSVADVSYLAKLTVLVLTLNPLVTFADLSHNLPNIVNIKMTGIQFECCRDYAWVKEHADLFSFEGVTYINDEPCSSPAKWVGRSLEFFTYQDIYQEPCSE